MPTHPLNWINGWTLLLLAFLTGAALGMFFHREDWWGGYDSFRRRIVRLGHIACAALGILNILYSIGPLPAVGSGAEHVASIGFVVGGYSMPVVCFLSGWKKPFRHLFFVPVVALMSAVIAVIWGS